MGSTGSELAAVRRALRTPRGRYAAARAAQLSGIPQRTLYDWAQHDVLVPDHRRERPKRWSYRDLVLLRLVLWLRMQGMTRDLAGKQVAETKRMLATDDPMAFRIRTDGRHVFLGDAEIDEVAGQAALQGMVRFLNAFELDTEATRLVEEIGRRSLWGPDLVQPSSRSRISPWVMGGEPCVRDTRLPTATLYALVRDRGLSPSGIIRLYPELVPDDVTDAVALESRLRRERLRAVA